MTLPSSFYLPHPENQPFDAQVNETIRILLEQAAAEGIGPAEIRFTANVTPFPDEHVTILREQMKTAELTVMLVDDGADPRAGTIRSTELEPIELACLDQAAAARAEGDARRSASE